MQDINNNWLFYYYGKLVPNIIFHTERDFLQISKGLVNFENPS